MIIAQATQVNERPLLIVGLTDGDQSQLDSGFPVVHDLDQLGVVADLLLVNANTPEDLSATLGDKPTEGPVAEGGVEYDVCVDGGFVGETTFDSMEANRRAIKLKGEDPDAVVTVLLSVRSGG